MPEADGQRRVSEIAEAIAFVLALLVYLWLLAIPLPWLGVLVLLAVAVSWRRRSLTSKSLGLGWKELRASGRRWGVVWIFSVSLFLILGYRSLFSFAALTHGAVYFAWGAAQQVVYQSMTYLPLRDNLKSRRLAAVLAGVAFSIMHVPNPILVPATYVWGVASSLLFERCRTVWGLALLQTMLSSTLFWITPRELNRDFQIGPYYYEMHSPQAPDGTFAPPISIWIVSEWASDPRRLAHYCGTRAVPSGGTWLTGNFAGAIPDVVPVHSRLEHHDCVGPLSRRLAPEPEGQPSKSCPVQILSTNSRSSLPGLKKGIFFGGTSTRARLGTDGARLGTDGTSPRTLGSAK